MYTNEEQHPVMAALGALDQQDFVSFAQFGAENAQAATKQQPFYLAADPVAAFMKALQRTLGVPVTGNWDRATHDAVMAAMRADELRQQQEGSPAPLTVVPAWGQPWTPESDPSSTSVENSVILAMEVLDHIGARMPTFVQALGFASEQAMANDSQWLLNKDSIAASIMAHMLAQETAAVAIVPVPPTGDCPAGKYKNAAGECVEIPPTVVVRPVVAKVWYKRTSTWVIAGGVLLVGGLLIAATRKG
jgi:hypothetical protein